MSGFLVTASEDVNSEGYETQPVQLWPPRHGELTTTVTLDVWPKGDQPVTIRHFWLWEADTRERLLVGSMTVPETYRPGPMRPVLTGRQRRVWPWTPRERARSGSLSVWVPTWFIEAAERVLRERGGSSPHAGAP